MAAIPPLAESATTAGHKISAFFQSLILLFLDTLHRAINTLSGNKQTSPTPSTTGPGEPRETDEMAAPNPPNKPSNLKIVPALPLLPPRPATKENDPSSKQPKRKPGSMLSQQEPETRVVDAMARLELTTTPQPGMPKPSIPVDGVMTGENAVHAAFMREALDMARLALRTNETPVGCVFVYQGRVVARGMNATNVTRNGTRHAELMAISALLSYAPGAEMKPRTTDYPSKQPLADKTNKPKVTRGAWGDVDPKDGHIYPYGQKLHPSPRVDRTIFSECTLYVTVEPCVMCASLLRQLRIKKVYFGAVNDKFGGTGGVFRIHLNSTPINSNASGTPPFTRQDERQDFGPTLENQPTPLHAIAGGNGLYGDAKGTNGNTTKVLSERPAAEGDGGNVEPGYEVEGGWGRDEAVTLLRQFYVQENNRAPIPRKKEGRAARLAVMMERDGHAGGPMIKAGSLSTTPELATPEPATPEESPER